MQQILMKPSIFSTLGMINFSVDRGFFFCFNEKVGKVELGRKVH